VTSEGAQRRLTMNRPTGDTKIVYVHIVYVYVHMVCVYERMYLF
jgi:hypothetical protein